MNPRRAFAKLKTAQGRAEARFAISCGANRVLYPLGFALLSDHFYQPLPGRRALVDHRQDLRFIATIDEQLELVASVLGRYGKEIEETLVSFGYGVDAQLPRVDADFLYALVRHLRPRRVLEVGSGSSSAVIAAALHENASRGHNAATFTSIDPYAVPWIDRELHPQVRVEHRAQRLQEIDSAVWRELEAGDILFVDSSHVFKPGSDVEFEFLHVYPLLCEGVVVHLHDIFFPRDYPLEWNLERSHFWNEQHVLAAVLENSDRYRVIACLSAIHTCRPGELERLVPGFRGEYVPGSLWLTVASPGNRASGSG